ncbi:MAG TPA: DR2241 family protein [Chthoniobacterales bacterium]|jgi:sirohydrochlorin cobaltochelatase
MPDAIERALEAALQNGACCIGQIVIAKTSSGGFALCHRDDQDRQRDWHTFRSVHDAIEIARSDDGGNYRPLKTAPNLRHGWRMELLDLGEVRRALDYFYPGRLAMFATWQESRLSTTPLRETLDRQSGIYRVAAKIADDQLDDVIANFCRSDGGCLRTILWKRDQRGAIPSTKLPAEKFDPAHDQTGCGERTIPLLCQEACGLLVNECRGTVKGANAADL